MYCVYVYNNEIMYWDNVLGNSLGKVIMYWDNILGNNNVLGNVII